MVAMPNNEIAKVIGIISAICTAVGVAITLLFHVLIFGSEFGTLKANQLATQVEAQKNTADLKVLTPIVQYHGWRLDSIVHQLH